MVTDSPSTGLYFEKRMFVEAMVKSGCGAPRAIDDKQK